MVDEYQFPYESVALRDFLPGNFLPSLAFVLTSPTIVPFYLLLMGALVVKKRHNLAKYNFAASNNKSI